MDFLSDDIIYRRTQQGQQAILRLTFDTPTLAERVLARVNGFTDLRRLIDLSPESSVEIGSAVRELLERGLITPVERGGSGA